MKIMATKFGYKRDAIRVKAMKIDGNCMPDTRKFSVDPQITSFDILRSILTKAFDLKQNFSICYRVLDDYDQETYLPLLSDWDLDAAFVRAADPCLCLRIEIKMYEEIGEEWDANSTSFSWITDKKISLRLQGLIMNHVEKTVNLVRGALNFIEDVQPAQEVTTQPPRPPLTDTEFKKYLDHVGQLIKPEDFKKAIYFGGVEPSFRKVIWKHLLNVYPKDLSGQQRIEFMKKKTYEYDQLKSAWKNIRKNEQMIEDLAFVTSMVKKDVLRTDRQHYFYAGSDDNQNIVSLFNILTTYALNHPSVSYCQGMSDLASPLLVTMGNEAHAYICFCSLMRRLASNFLIDGITMTQRFQHLSDGLMYYDPTFYAYLKAHQADDLLFCYRWLLLEMKREFAFEDALRMLEVMWSSLPPTAPPDDLPLYEMRFSPTSQFPPPPSPSPRETPYTKVCALRRQTASRKMLMINRSLDESVIAKRRLNSSFHNKTKKYSSLDENTFFRDRYKNSKSLSNKFTQPVISMPSSSNSVYNSSSSDSDSCKSLSYQEKNSFGLEAGKRFQSQLENTATKNSVLEEDVLDKKESVNEVVTKQTSNKIVKNFNEFLTLKKKITDKKQKENCADNETLETKPNSSADSNSSPDDSGEYYPMTTSMTQKLSKDLENLEKQVFGLQIEESGKNSNADTKISGEDVFIWENPLQYKTTRDETTGELKSDKGNVDAECSRKEEQRILDVFVNGEISNYDDLEELENLVKCNDKNMLPGPTEFGGGNPFLMFLCIAVLCQHRDIILNSRMDYNEVAMHFDKMVRKHNVIKVLNQARIMYASYLKQHRHNYLKV